MEINREKISNWYDKNYKKILFIPVFLVIICLIYITVFAIQTGDIMRKDVSLAGGTSITIDGTVDTSILESKLSEKIPDVNFRKLTDVASGKNIALIIESSESPDVVKEAIGSLGVNLTEENSSTEFTGPSLSNQFYKQLMIALVISFILMSIVIFSLFKTFTPSIAVVFAAFSNIVVALAILNIFEVKISAAGIAAFLTLIGYSVDTDILLTTRVLKKREGTVNKRIYGAFKTGILMTATALAAILPGLFIVTGLPSSFKQIFLILAIGLSADIINTWIVNAGIIKWYCNSKNIK
jgi:preprotein translocase subunit SecF